MEAAADPSQQYTVIVAVRGTRDGKEFLMVRHKARGWELPGGKIEANEGPVHCALREFREETGHLLSSPRGNLLNHFISVMASSAVVSSTFVPSAPVKT